MPEAKFSPLEISYLDNLALLKQTAWYGNLATMSSAISLKKVAAPIGPILAVVAAIFMLRSGFTPEAAITLGVTVLCVVWWVFEPVPIPVTSLAPLAILPLTGVLTSAEVGASYGHPVVLLLLGGFILAMALQHSGAHKRMALTMVRAFGGDSSRRLVFGFMAASAVLSMWISNTATTLMLLPVAMAVLEKSKDPRLAWPLLLGIAHAASVGGIATPIGTPPNLILMGVYADVVGQEIGFLEWMAIGLPVVLVLVPLVGLWLTRRLSHRGQVSLPAPGAWSPAEIRVTLVFALTALAWITRGTPFGGWTEWFDLPYSNDAIVALLAVIAMFIIPNGKGGRLLNWETAATIPWGMLILFGSGFTIAAAFTESGLSQAIGTALAGLSTWPVLAVMAIICLCVTFLTETTSNTATTTLLMPILAATALGAGIDPMLLMVPAAMSASCAFMLPVATAPNVIVFASGRIPAGVMAREGTALNFIGAAVITCLCYFLLT